MSADGYVDAVEVRDCGALGMGLLAKVDAPRGTVIITVAITEANTQQDKGMHTIQIGADRNINTKGLPISFTAHGYDTNCHMAINHNSVQLLARKDIQAGDLLAANYNTFEWHISCPFKCAETGRQVRHAQYYSRARNCFTVSFATIFLRDFLLFTRTTRYKDSSMRMARSAICS